ncbi:MAG: Outer membrane efflux protein BepC [Gammaproteobacteria bacterium]|nr:MAG: Outer membrane efflux protein BepC [Gammaproteobacteria bacterium]
MARTSRKLLLVALSGVLLLPSQNQARVLSETRVGYGEGDSVSDVPSASQASAPPSEEAPLVITPTATEPQRNQSFSVKIPVLTSQPEIVPVPQSQIREDAESVLLRELEAEKDRPSGSPEVPLADDDSSDVSETSILGISGLLMDSVGPEINEIEVADGRDADTEPLNPAVSNEIDLIGREMSRIMQELSDGEKDPTKRLPIEPVIEAAKEAVSKSPTVLQIGSSLNLYLAQKDEITAGKRPQVSASVGGGNRSFETESSGTVASNSGAYQSRSVSASQLLFDFGSVDNQIGATEIRGEAATAELRAIKGQIFLDAIGAFYEVQRSLLQLRLARENVNSRRAFVEFVRDRADLGASSAADVVRAESRVAEAMDLMSSAAQSLARSQAVYRQYYGKEAQPYALPREISVDELDFLDLEAYLDTHPDAVRTRLLVDAAQKDYRATVGQQRGALNFQASMSQTKNPGSSNFLDDRTLTLNFESKLYAGGSKDALLRQSEAQLAQAKFERDRVYLDIQRNLRDAFAEYEGKLAGVSARILVTEGAENSYEISKEMYAFSRISLFELLKTQEELFSAGQRLIDSIVDRALSKYRLLHAAQQLPEVIFEG